MPLKKNIFLHFFVILDVYNNFFLGGGGVGKAQKHLNLTFHDFQTVITHRKMLQIS